MNLEKQLMITYGEELNKDGDKVLTCPCDVGTCLSLDYILEIIPDIKLFKKSKEKNVKLSVENYENQFEPSNEVYFKNNNYNNFSKSKLRVNHTSSKIEKFLIKRKPYTQLSDHYGLSVELEYFA
jgi:hypothetical protein